MGDAQLKTGREAGTRIAPLPGAFGWIPRFAWLLLPLLLFTVIAFPVAAADKNGVAPNAVSLPSGPGSIEGLGESFQPMLNTGTASFAVEFDLPSVAAGHSPRLALAYNSGRGDGPAGIGWAFGPGSISRQTDKGIPRYVDASNSRDDDHDGEVDEFDELDRFIGIEDEELIHLSDGTYRPRIEGTFTRYERVGSHWEARLRDGTRLEFGLSAAARITDGSGVQVFRWLLEKTTDTNGNVAEYTYASFPGSDNQKYLVEIRYGPGASPWGAFYFARLTYEERPDWRKDYRSGFPVKTGRRLAQVDVGIQGTLPEQCAQGDWNADGTGDALIRRYRLAYAGTSTARTLLSSVTQFGSDGINYLPPISFAYSAFDPDLSVSAANSIITTASGPPTVMDGGLVEFIDLNRDSLPDLLQTDLFGAGHTYYRNLGVEPGAGGGELRWSAGRAIDSPDGLAGLLHLVEDSVYLADMDGDGISDLIHSPISQEVSYYRNQGDGSWGDRNPMSIQDTRPPAPAADDDTRTSDFDFDKRMDVVKSTDAGYTVWLNLGDGRYGQEVRTSGASMAGQVLRFSDSAVHLADLNGDRISDVARIRPTHVLFAASMGHGEFDAAVEIPIPEVTLTDGTNGQVERARLEDINGDGLADLVVERAESGTLWYWLNLGTNSFSHRYAITGMPTLYGPGTVTRWADVNGNGTTDLVYADSTAASPLRAVDIGKLVGGSAHPNLLMTIRNGLGVTTAISYRSSTEFYLEELAGSRPWTSTIPFPVSVVAQVITTTGLDLDETAGVDQYEKEFAYRDGFYEDREKAFRGFEEVKVKELGDVTAPSRIDVHSFFTGGPDGADNDGDGETDEVSGKWYREEDALKGMVRGVSVQDEGGSIFSEATNDWRVRTLALSTDDIELRFAYNQAAETSLVEGTPNPETIRITYEYDDYGNVTAERNHGALSIAGDEAFTHTEYINDTTAWMLGFPMRRYVTNQAGVIASETRSYYDGPAYQGLPIGQIAKGNLSRQESWIKGGIYVDSQRSAFDAFGNVVGTLNPNGGQRIIDYDSTLHTYPVLESIQVGGGNPNLAITAAYNLGLSTLTSSDDFNGHTTTFGYDAFGRLTSLARPGDSQALPTLSFAYTMADPDAGLLYSYDALGALTLTSGAARPSGVATHAREVSGSPATLDGVVYVDGLGRKLGVVEEDVQGFVVNEAVLFNAMGNPRWSFMPYRVGAMDFARPPPAGPAVESHYDATGRNVLRTNPPDSHGLVSSAATAYQPLSTIKTDENEISKKFFQDGLERLIEVDEENGPATYVTRYSYDALGNLEAILDAQANLKTMEYDGLSRRTALADPNRGAMSYVFDPASNPIRSVDAKGQAIGYVYDLANRLVSENYLDQTGDPQTDPVDVSYVYDEPLGPVDLGDGTSQTPRNARGELVAVIDLSGEEHTSYDARGRPEWTVKRIPDPMNGIPVSYTTAMTHDAMDRITSLVYPDNDRITYEYNARGLLETIAGGPSGNILSSLAYTAAGQTEQSEYGNGVTTSYVYDPRLRLTDLHTAVGPADPLLSYRYTFDQASNILEIDDLRPASISLPSGSPRRNNQIFDYDDLYRLTRVDYGFQIADSAAHVAYSYDSLGNMLSKSSNLAPGSDGEPVDLGAMHYGEVVSRPGCEGRGAGVPAGPHALTSTGAGAGERLFTYDPNGNMTCLDDEKLTWDFKDRLVAVEGGAFRAEYVYDHSDRRIVKKVWDGTPPGGATEPPTTSALYVDRYFEVRENGQPVKYVWNSDTRVARVTGTLAPGAERIQRFSLSEGWNLIALAVQASDAVAQLGIGSNPGVTDAFLWNPVTQGYDGLTAGSPIPAGSVVWLNASAPTTLQVFGTYTEPTSAPINAGSNFVPVLGLQALDLGQALPPEVEQAWAFDAENQVWRGRFTGDLGFLSNAPAAVSPGDVIYVQASGSSQLTLPNAASRIRYYQQDHLGSSNVVADGSGNLVEEVIFYPFGHPRNEYRPGGGDGEPYKFTQKELDAESRLQYFEARYLTGPLGRFLSVDPHQDVALDELLRIPQEQNSYSYVRNRPLGAHDPSGRNTVWLGGAGYEGETAGYSKPIIEKFKAAGVPEPEYVPVSGFGQAGNILTTLASRSKPMSSPALLKATDPVLKASNEKGGQRNLIGYSYGSVIAAQAALKLAKAGKTVDNLILLGAPISNNSKLYKALLENKNIRNVTRIDIPNDPFSGGINLSKDQSGCWRGASGCVHFHYISNEQGQQDKLAKQVKEIVSSSSTGDE